MIRLSTKCRCRVVSTPPSYSVWNLRPGDFRNVFSSSRQMPGSISSRPQPLPSTSFPVIHWIIIASVGMSCIVGQLGMQLFCLAGATGSRKFKRFRCLKCAAVEQRIKPCPGIQTVSLLSKALLFWVPILCMTAFRPQRHMKVVSNAW